MPLFLFTLLFSLFVSRLAGWLADSYLTAPAILVPSFIGLRLSHNPGISFGMQLPSPLQEVIIIAALIGVGYIASRSTLNRMNASGFGLILGGALANLIDRSMHGVVTDFFSVGSFPIFNVADSCITVGAAMLIWAEMRKGLRVKG